MERNRNTAIGEHYQVGASGKGRITLQKYQNAVRILRRDGKYVETPYIDKNLKLYLLMGALVVNRDSNRELSVQNESHEGLVRVLGKLELL